MGISNAKTFKWLEWLGKKKSKSDSPISTASKTEKWGMRPKITGANIPASKKNNKKVWRVQKLKETTTETLWNAEENVQKWANEKQNSKSSSKVKMKRQKKKLDWNPFGYEWNAKWL